MWSLAPYAYSTSFPTGEVPSRTLLGQRAVPHTGIWECKLGERWQAYDKSTIDKLNAAAQRGEKTCYVSLEHRLYEIDLVEMRQMGYGSARPREVRCRKEDTQKDREETVGQRRSRSIPAGHRAASGAGHPEVTDRYGPSMSVPTALAPALKDSQLAECFVHPNFHEMQLSRDSGYWSRVKTISMPMAPHSATDAITGVARQLCEMFHADSFLSSITLRMSHGGNMDHFLAGLNLGLLVLRAPNLPRFSPSDELSHSQKESLREAWERWQRCSRERLAQDSDKQKQPPPAMDPIGGSFEWLCSQNDPRSRLMRLVAAAGALRYSLHLGNTLQAVQAPCFIFGRKMLAENAPSKLPILKDLRGSQSAFSVAAQEALLGRKVAVVNASSAYQVGGGFLSGGRHASEEAACSRSTLFPALQEAARKRSFGASHTAWLPDDAALLIPAVRIFAMGTMEGYAPLPEDYPAVSVIAVAMPNLNPRVTDSPLCKLSSHELKELLAVKMKAVLRAAGQSGAEVLVMPDTGCGVFGNSPTSVATALADALKTTALGAVNEVIFTGSDQFLDALLGPPEQG